MNQRTEQVFVVCIAIVSLVLIVVMSRECNGRQELRLECIKAGHQPAECREFGKP